MSTPSQTSERKCRPGRLLVWLGLALVLLGPLLYMIQINVLGKLTTPWYLPVLATAGLGLTVWACFRCRTIIRLVNVTWMGLLTAGIWYFLLSFSILPPYDGPAKVESPFPAFSTTLASGESFTQDNLKGPRNTVMVFFRGRW